MYGVLSYHSQAYNDRRSLQTSSSEPREEKTVQIQLPAQ